MDTYPLPVPVHVTWVIYPVGHTCALGWYRWYTMSPWGTHSVCGVQHVMHGVTLPVPHTDIPHYGWIPTWVHHPVDTWSWGDTPDPGWIPCWGYRARDVQHLTDAPTIPMYVPATWYHTPDPQGGTSWWRVDAPWDAGGT